MSRLHQSAEDGDLARLLNRVPEVTLAFWVVKILATTVGETAADFLSTTLGMGLTVTSYIMGALFVAALLMQLRTRRYVPASYWLVVVLISVVGTLISDNLVDNLGVQLTTTTTVFSAALLATFACWYLSERTLSVHTIYTLRRELFYWATILFTFSLGTSAGDLVAERLAVGYGPSVLMFGGLIGLVYLAYRCGLNAILAFWVAYILTRPLGASMGDLLSQPVKDGGVGLGTIVTSALFLAVIAAMVAHLTIAMRRAKGAAPQTRMLSGQGAAE